MSKLGKMQRFLPSFYHPSTNTMVRGLLYAWAGEDDGLTQSVQNAKDQIFVQTAALGFLDSLGSNVGVYRPITVSLTDNQFRNLIPLLSFTPKQVITIVKAILAFFFGPNNPNVYVDETHPNQLIIHIPNTVPTFKRGLRGAWHVHAYGGVITAVDNFLKTLTIDLDESSKNLQVDELSQAFIGQGNILAKDILSNTAGNTGVTLQFSAGTDLSGFALDKFQMCLANYPGSFLFSSKKPFTMAKVKSTINPGITAGSIVPVLFVQDASRFPDARGYVVFNYGRDNEEVVPYFRRPSNTTLLLDPTYTFLYDHSIGEVVNLAIKPTVVPNINGKDFSVYFTGVTAARELAQSLVESVTAAGVVVTWVLPS